MNTAGTAPRRATIRTVAQAAGVSTATVSYVLSGRSGNTESSGVSSETELRVREAALGLGMTPAQVLWRVELPVAWPVILAGLRTATVLTVGTAALAAEIGAPCLGDLIFQGVSTGSVDLILAGAIPTALLALAADSLLGWAGRAAIPAGLRP